MVYNNNNSTKVHYRLNHKTYEQLKQIHEYRKVTCKHNKTWSDTIRLLLTIGIKSYTEHDMYKSYQDKIQSQQHEQELQQNKISELEEIKQLQELFGVTIDEDNTLE